MLKTIIGILVAVCVINIIVSLILGHIQNYYNNNVRSIFSGVIGSLFAIISILLILSVTQYKYSKTVLIVNFIILTILSVLGIIFQFLLGFYFGGWACLVWLLSALLLGYELKFGQRMRIRQTIQVQKTIPLNQKVKVNTLDSIQTVIPNQSQSSQKDKKCSGCRSCCHPCCSITTLIFMALYASVAIACYSNFSQYPAYGKILEIQNQSGDQTYYVHAFCIGQSQPLRPTIVMEHGGGSNSIAFVELGKQLNKKNWKLCSYDRLGYGRSSLIPRYLTREQSAYITNQVIKTLLENDTNKNIVIGGWSAGVEISQIYKKLYPNNVKGMIFLDGYPDYLSLIGIYNNKSEPLTVNTAGTLQIIRILQPLGLVFIPGSNPIQDQTSRNYYRAYYQTGYFWQSQYFDVSNPDITTTWLTDKAGADTVPYPNAKFALNWPDIDVPLLVLPANQTVKGQQNKGMYEQQCNKYLQKCTNVNKKLTIMKGDHGFVLQTPANVATQIDIFFSPLF